MQDTIEPTDEPCGNCGTNLIAVKHDGVGATDAAVCYTCPPERGCGMVNRYVRHVDEEKLL